MARSDQMGAVALWKGGLTRHRGGMRHRDLIDYPHRLRRAALIALVTILVLGLGVGGAFGTVLSQAFDALHIEKFARQFSGH